MERRVNVRGIIVNDNGHIFAVKHRTHTGAESEYWATPGGGLDLGEPLLDGLAREMIEETGIKPVIGKLLFIQQYVGIRKTGEKQEGMELFYLITNSQDYVGEIDFSAASHGHEIAKAAFIDPKTNDILPDFLRTIDVASYVKNDLPVYCIDNLQETTR